MRKDGRKVWSIFFLSLFAGAVALLGLLWTYARRSKGISGVLMDGAFFLYMFFSVELKWMFACECLGVN